MFDYTSDVLIKRVEVRIEWIIFFIVLGNYFLYVFYDRRPKYMQPGKQSITTFNAWM